MPKTIILKMTWRCVECDYSQSFEPTKEAMDFQFNHNTGISLTNVQKNECPSCALRGNRGSQMKKETNPEKKTTTTVMGEEDIEPEIDERNESFYRTRVEKEIEQHISSMKENGEIVSSIRETKVREQELSLLEKDIELKKKDNFFLTTEAQKNAYREKRKEDIVDAIIAARKNEDK